MAPKNPTRPVMERRVFNLTNCEVRSADADSPAVFSGYAAVFNELSVNLGGFRERIMPGCFRAAVDEGQDVRFLINHDANLILGRSASGTLKLAEDEIGLRVECELPDTTYAEDLAESMRRKDIDAMSFGFTTVADEWKEKDAETGLPIRELVRANLFDVSAVAYPAYPDTSAELRMQIEEQTPELLERAARAAEELEAKPEPEAPETAPETPAEPEAPAPETSAEPETPAAETPAEPEAREGKVLSQQNMDAVTAAAELLQKVIAAAAANGGEGDLGAQVLLEGLGTTQGTYSADAQVDIVRPNMAAFREWVEERGWDWDDDWSVWALTQMIESGSLFLLYGDDPNDDDAAEDAPIAAAMKLVMGQLADLLAQVVANGVREKRDDDGKVVATGVLAKDGTIEWTDVSEDAPEPEVETEQRDRFELERRKLKLAEREFEFAELVG